MVIKKFCQVLATVCLFYIVQGSTFPLIALAATEEESNLDSGEKAPASLPTLYLRVGQRYPIEGVLAQNARISDDSVATAHQTPEGLLLIGRKVGTTTLHVEISGKEAQINLVVRHGMAGNQSGAQQRTSPWGTTLAELKSIPGIHLSGLGQKTVLQGEVLGRAAYQRILLHLKNFPANLIVLATPAPGIKASLLEQVHSLLINRGLTAVRVSNAGNRFFLEGTVSAPSDVEHAFEIVQSVLPNIENHLAIPIRVDPTITVRVFILELSRQAHLVLGLSWPTSIQNAFLLSPTAALFSPTWFASLNHLSSNGQARVLAEPMLAVKNGSHAELSAGGEIPIRITGRHENKVIWKHYGLKIKIHVVGVAGKHIRTKIDTQSSQLDEATAVDGVPGLRSTALSTEVDALEGQPILLTGLFQAEAAKDVDKVPLIGNIPLLGELFKSRRFRDRESELLVALLPTFGSQTTTIPLQSLRGLEFDKRWRPLD